MNHFIDLLDWDGDQILKLLKDAARLKKAQLKGKHKPRLEGKVLGMVFEKPSLRTRVSFQAGMAELGRGIALECCAVARAEGASLSDAVADEVLARVLATPAGSGNSMYYDRRAGRPLELDARNGAIVRIGKRHGIATPLNSAACALLAAQEKR